MRAFAALVLLANMLASTTARAGGSHPLHPLPVQQTSQDPRGYGELLGSDFRYLSNNLVADFEDTLSAPRAIARLMQDRRSFWTVMLTGAGLGLTMGLLDKPARNAFKDPSNSNADTLRHGADLLLLGSTGLIYAYGLARDDQRAREVALTTMESTLITGLMVTGTKVLFGRSRPKQNEGPFKFGGSGHSFVSNAATPAFVLATGISEYFNNSWYAAVPAYGAASAVGWARMSKDAHWLSDIMASALIGVGTTKLLLHMHGRNAQNPSRFRVFPMVTSGGGVGLQASYIWGVPDPKTPVEAAAALPPKAAIVPAPKMGPGFKAWMAYQRGAFVKPMLDARTRFDPQMPEVDLGDFARSAAAVSY